MGNAESAEPMLDEDELLGPRPMYDENNSDYGNGASHARSKGGNGSPFEPIMVSDSASPRRKANHHRFDDDDEEEGEEVLVPETAPASTDTSSGFEVSHEDKYDDEYVEPSDATSSAFDALEEMVTGDGDDDDGVMSLMDASAAVFGLLAGGGDLSVDMDGKPSNPSAVASSVFQYLQEETRKGNTQAMVNFLETASLVSNYIQKQKHRPDPAGNAADGGAAPATDGDHSVSNDSAAVFHLLDDLRSVDHDSVHASAVFQLLDEAQSVFANDAASVSERSSAIFALLDEAQSVDDQSVSQFSSAVFRVLDEIKKNATTDDDGRSISEASAAIFHVLDAKSPRNANSPRNSKKRYGLPPSANISTIDELSGAEKNPINLIDGTVGASRAVAAPINDIKLAPGNVNDPPADHNTVTSIRMSDSETEAEKNDSVETAQDGYYQAAQKQQEDYPELSAALQPKNHGPNTFQVAPYLLESVDDGDASTLTKDQYRNEVTMNEEIDLDFVEHFDAAFNEFVGQHPKFLMKDPDLVHNLRVTKLQKLLEFNVQCELDLRNELNHLRVRKAAMEATYQRQLKDASRRKAAREINLQGDLNKLHLATKKLSARLLWDLVSLAERKSKQQYHMRQHYKNLMAEDESDPTLMNRRDLLELIPPGSDGQKLRDAALAPSSTYGRSVGKAAHQAPALSLEQEKDLRRFQVDNAFLNAEVTVLKKKLAYQKLAAKKHAWVESVLLRLDEKTMAKLGERFQSKAGVKF